MTCVVHENYGIEVENKLPIIIYNSRFVINKTCMNKHNYFLIYVITYGILTSIMCVYIS